jgi:hypothetical protein
MLFISALVMIELLHLSVFYSAEFALCRSHLCHSILFQYLTRMRNTTALCGINKTVLTTKLIKLHRRKEKVKASADVSRGRQFCQKEHKVDEFTKLYFRLLNFVLACLEFCHFVSR